MLNENAKGLAQSIAQIHLFSESPHEPVYVDEMEDHGPVLVVSDVLLDSFRNVEKFVKDALVFGTLPILDDESISKMAAIYELLGNNQWDFPMWDGQEITHLQAGHLKVFISFGAYCHRAKGTPLSDFEQSFGEGIYTKDDSFETILDNNLKDTITEYLGEMLCYLLYDGKLFEFNELHRLIGAAAQSGWIQIEDLVQGYSRVLSEIEDVLIKKHPLDKEVMKHYQITQVIHAVMSKMDTTKRIEAIEAIKSSIKPIKQLTRVSKTRDQELLRVELAGFEKSLHLSSELASCETGMWLQISMQGSLRFSSKLNLPKYATRSFAAGSLATAVGIAASAVTSKFGYSIPGPVLMFAGGLESIFTNADHDMATELQHLNPYRPNAVVVRGFAESAFISDTQKRKLSKESIGEFQKLTSRLAALELIISDPSSVLAAQQVPYLDL